MSRLWQREIEEKMAASLPDLQLGFRWAAGDWALLALWSVVMVAWVTYEVMMLLA